MKKAALLLMIVVVIFLAGCIGQKEEKPIGVATGVIIKSFSSEDVSEVFSGEDATFTLYVENVGEEDATNVVAKFFGLSVDWTPPSSGNIGISDLSKAQPQYKISGGQGDAQFSSTAPPNLKVDTTYTVNVRVAYDYGTTASGNIKVYNRSYLKTLPPAEQEKITKSSGIASFSVIKAPITVSLIGAARPFFVDTRAGNATITIQISNIGQGQPYWGKEGDRNIIIRKLMVNNQPCALPPEGIVTLPRVGYKSISCSKPLPSTETYTTFPVEVELDYKYFVDSSTSIKVLKETV